MWNFISKNAGYIWWQEVDFCKTSMLSKCNQVLMILSFQCLYRKYHWITEDVAWKDSLVVMYFGLVSKWGCSRFCLVEVWKSPGMSVPQTLWASYSSGLTAYIVTNIFLCIIRISLVTCGYCLLFLVVHLYGSLGFFLQNSFRLHRATIRSLL